MQPASWKAWATEPRLHGMQIHLASAQQETLANFLALFTIMSTQPTHCLELVPGIPAYIGNVDACKYGVGGTWLSGSKTIAPIVWRFRWPPEVVEAFDDGLLTINDLEMAGILMHYILLEMLVPLWHIHVAIWCDNTSAVAWTAKLSSMCSTMGQQLARALALQICANQSSPLAPLSIPSRLNGLADIPSRSFVATGEPGNYNWSDATFYTNFNSCYCCQCSSDRRWKRRYLPSIMSCSCTKVCCCSRAVDSLVVGITKAGKSWRIFLLVLLARKPLAPI